MRKGVRKHFFNENYFENIDTEEKAYWLGFISADGCVSKSSEYNSYRLSINLSIVDKNHLEKFRKAICANDIELQEYTSTKGFSNPNGSTTCRIVLNSLKLCTDLAKYYVHQRKSYDIEMPDINRDLIPHYLRGLFDGDGSYSCLYDSKKNRYRYLFEIVGASEKLLRQVQTYLLSVNITFHIYYRKGTNYIRLMSGSKREILKLIDLLYSDAHIYLDRKYEKINEIKSLAV